MFEKLEGVTLHRPIEGIWSYFQSRGAGVPEQNFKMFKKQGGTQDLLL